MLDNKSRAESEPSRFAASLPSIVSSEATALSVGDAADKLNCCFSFSFSFNTLSVADAAAVALAIAGESSAFCFRTLLFVDERSSASSPSVAEEAPPSLSSTFVDFSLRVRFFDFGGDKRA